MLIDEAGRIEANVELRKEEKLADELNEGQNERSCDSECKMCSECSRKLDEIRDFLFKHLRKTCIDHEAYLGSEDNFTANEEYRKHTEVAVTQNMGHNIQITGNTISPCGNDPSTFSSDSSNDRVTDSESALSLNLKIGANDSINETITPSSTLGSVPDVRHDSEVRTGPSYSQQALNQVILSSVASPVTDYGENCTSSKDSDEEVSLKHDDSSPTPSTPTTDSINIYNRSEKDSGTSSAASSDDETECYLSYVEQKDDSSMSSPSKQQRKSSISAATIILLIILPLGCSLLYPQVREMILASTRILTQDPWIDSQARVPLDHSTPLDSGLVKPEEVQNIEKTETDPFLENTENGSEIVTDSPERQDQVPFSVAIEDLGGHGEKSGDLSETARKDPDPSHNYQNNMGELLDELKRLLGIMEGHNSDFNTSITTMYEASGIVLNDFKESIGVLVVTIENSIQNLESKIDTVGTHFSECFAEINSKFSSEMPNLQKVSESFRTALLDVEEKTNRMWDRLDKKIDENKILAEMKSRENEQNFERKLQKLNDQITKIIELTVSSQLSNNLLRIL